MRETSKQQTGESQSHCKKSEKDNERVQLEMHDQNFFTNSGLRILQLCMAELATILTSV